MYQPESPTILILKYCRIADGRELKQHSTWCELETGLWHYCDCGYAEYRDEKEYLETTIKKRLLNPDAV